MASSKKYTWRLLALLAFLIVVLAGLLWRLIDLNILNRSFLVKQSKARILRTVSIPAYRGMITDRLGDPLAISTPVESVWVNPSIFHPTSMQLNQLARILFLSSSEIERKIQQAHGREFVYLRRANPPAIAEQVSQLQIPGVFLQREYKRYYPEGEVIAHVVGLTNVDDQGQEGLELAYNDWLSGVPGRKEVIKDRLGRIISNVALIKKPQQGKKLVLSIDHRIQYLAYRTLKEAVHQFHAKAGSIVVLNVKTGEILAVVNQPSYNPNLRPEDKHGRYRNRAVTDTFEPGSVIKPFNIALALESGKYTKDSTINTSPGWMWIGGYKIKDDGLDFGVINLTQVLQKSSNIGAAKIMLSLKPQQYWELLHRLGFGERTLSGFPGESAGSLISRTDWLPSVVATLAYGYGISTTALQLAQAYAILANDGIKVPVTFVKKTTKPQGVRVLQSSVAKTVMTMLEAVVNKGGTGTRAAVLGYHVAGKTGTAYIAKQNGYDRTKYMSSFVGMAPASNPQVVVAVTIREPQGQHFGGLVAAPVFAKVMGGSLRILDISPDNILTTMTRTQ